jgi:hypothetical protein
MTRLVLYGQSIDAPPAAIATWALAELVGPLEIVGQLHWVHSFALPRTSPDEAGGPLQAVIGHLRENEDITDLPRLANAIRLVRASLESVLEASAVLDSWEASHIQQDERNAHYEAAASQGPLRPPWHHQKRFQDRLGSLSAAFSRYLEILPPIVAMIQEMAPEVAASYKLERIASQIPAYKDLLTLGYEETIRREAAK